MHMTREYHVTHPYPNPKFIFGVFITLTWFYLFSALENELGTPASFCGGCEQTNQVTSALQHCSLQRAASSLCSTAAATFCAAALQKTTTQLPCMLAKRRLALCEAKTNDKKQPEKKCVKKNGGRVLRIDLHNPANKYKLWQAVKMHAG
jgi:hypothetical protein